MSFGFVFCVYSGDDPRGGSLAHLENIQKIQTRQLSLRTIASSFFSKNLPGL